MYSPIDEIANQHDHDHTLSSAGQVTQPLTHPPQAPYALVPQSIHVTIPPFLELILVVMVLLIGCTLVTIMLMRAFG